MYETYKYYILVMAMKQLKQQILFALSGGVAFLRGGGAFLPMSYSGLYWRLPEYREASVRGAVNELIVKGLVTKLSGVRLVQVRLTQAGREYLALTFPVVARGGWRLPGREVGRSLRGGRMWDGAWRLAIFHHPKEKKQSARDGVLVHKSGLMKRKPQLFLGGVQQARLLRGVLQKEGFAPVSRGVYISPFGVSRELMKLLVQRQWLGWVKVLESKKMALGDNREFAMGVWGLNTIYNKYKNLSTKVERLLYEVIRAKGLTDRIKMDYHQSLFVWFSLLKEDPGLPKSLLPEDWPPLEIAWMLDRVSVVVGELENDQL